MSITAQEIADTLITSERERKGIAQFSDEHPDIPIETAYAAQQAFVQSKLDAGESLVGYKLGLTSRNKQQAMGVDAPLYGRVTSGMLTAYGEPVRLDRFIHPRVECEIAFLLARDVDRACHDHVGAGCDRGGLRRGRRSRLALRGASSSRSPTWSPTTPARARSISARSRDGPTSWRICGCWVRGPGRR